jgi:Na+/H+-dicarboxylate symporter
MSVLREADSVFKLIICWIIVFTPFAVFSLIASAFGRESDIVPMFKNIVYLIAASLTAFGLQVILVYIGLFALLTHRNPFWYLSKMIPAQTMAFASSSSAATIPTMLDSVMSTGFVDVTVARFVVPIGVTFNAHGGAMYFVCACVWLAVINGQEVTTANFIMLIFVSVIAEVGVPPVPSSQVVVVITMFNTVFGTTGTPNGVGYIFAIDWFLDRISTVGNVTGNCVVAGIVGTICPRDESPMAVEEGGSTDSFSADSIDEEACY